eukprot:COSAG02_NODE_4182_length_5656_cov_2.473097_7_plen_178_part_01
MCSEPPCQTHDSCGAHSTCMDVGDSHICSKCQWESSNSGMQLMGLARAPSEAQASAEACERWCCTKLDGWSNPGTPGTTGRCQTWQYIPNDETTHFGCWAGASGNLSSYGRGTDHANEWIGATKYLGQNSGCESNPCQNGGTCDGSNGDKYTCKCATGWKGAECDQPTGCDRSSPCDH